MQWIALIALLASCGRYGFPRGILEARIKRGLVFGRVEEVRSADAHQAIHYLGEAEANGVLRGLCASPGSHTGAVRRVRSAADLERLRLGDVLVAEGTDFDLALLIQMAGAVVTEEGGLLGHAAVLARELQIPCIIGVPGATTLLQDGDVVEVDADAGTVVRRPAEGTCPPAVRLEPSAVRLEPSGELVPIAHVADPELAGRKAATLALLGRHGLPVQSEMYVIDTRICDAVTRSLLKGDRAPLLGLAERIVAAFVPRRLNLRSSSTGEDHPTGAAGVYRSVLDVPPAPTAIAEALDLVLAAASSPAAISYQHRVGQVTPAPLAILLTPSTRFDYLGTALSRSLWDRDSVLVEWFESGNRAGCPDRGGTLVEIPRDACGDTPRPWHGIPHHCLDLTRVAALTLLIERILGFPVEVEWGIADRAPTILQARMVVRCGEEA